MKELYEVLKNKDIKIKHFDWPKKIGSKYFDIEVSFKREGLNFVGRSLSLDADHALKVAAVEALERGVVYFGNFKTSNGIAGHTNPLAAQEFAINELLERDIVLCHYYGKVGFQKIDSIYLSELFSKFQSVMAQVDEYNVKLDFYYRKTQDAKHTVILVTTGLEAKVPFGMNLTAKCSNSISYSLEGAFKEAIPNIIHYQIANFSEALTIDQFNGLSFTSVQDQQSLARNIDFAKKASKHFYYSDKVRAVRDISISVEELNWKEHEQLSLFHGLPLYYYRALSKSTQKLFFGQVQKDSLNQNRLIDYAGEEKMWSKLPHPIG